MYLPTPTKNEFEIPPSGTFAARLYRFLDLGTQPKEFKGETKLVHLIRLSWELPTELMEKGDHAGKPFSIHQSYTWSMHEKATLRKTLESWRGKKFVDSDFGPGGFDTAKLIGVPCMLGIGHAERNGKIYANITTVSPLLKGYDMPPAVNPTIYFSFQELEGLAEMERKRHIDDLLTKLSQGTRETLMRAPEYQKAIGNAAYDDEHNHPPAALPDDAYNSDIPF